MKSTLRWLFRGLVLIVLLAAAGTFIPRPLWPSAQAADPEVNRTILVLSNPIHTDIAIQLDDAIRSRFAFLAKAGVPVDNPSARYVIFGWGGRSFYLETPRWADLKPEPVLRALTIDRSVMHVDVAGELREDDPAIASFVVTDDGIERMLRYVEQSFTRDAGQPTEIDGAGYGRYDAFFEANGSFNALLGCNTWTAGALREAGLRTGLWNPVPQTLAVSLKLFN